MKLSEAISSLRREVGIAGVSSISTERRFCPWLLGAVYLLLAFSVLMVFSTTAVISQSNFGSSTSIVLRHVMHIGLGLIAMYLVSRVHPRKYEHWGGAILLIALILLLLVLIPGLGVRVGGALRWLKVGPIRLQPGELAKLAVVLYIASYIGRHRESLPRFLNGVLIPLGISATVGALLLLEPDFGSMVVIMTVSAVQIFIGGTSVFQLLALGGLGALGVIGLIISSPYRFKRIEAFLDPFRDPTASGYQLIQSLIAVGSGGLLGVGLGASKQKLFYLPAAHTDFIFAVIAEELGILGALFVILLFLVIAVRGIIIARRLALDPFLSSLAIGLTALIVLPAFLNMGVVLGLLPTKGMVLPLVGYGGSNVLVNLLAMGILLRLSMTESY